MDGVIIVLGGLLPFGAVFIELVFIMNSLWQDDMFAMFSFLSVVCLIVAITCAELSIVMTYLFFVNEDYRYGSREEDPYSYFSSVLSLAPSDLHQKRAANKRTCDRMRCVLDTRTIARKEKLTSLGLCVLPKR